MRILRLTTISLALLVAGCSQTHEMGDRVPPPPPPVASPVAETQHGGGAGFRDVTIEGVSILGTWYAVQVLDDAQTTRDLEVGTMEMTLLVQPNGRSILTGVDRREGSGLVSFPGIVEGNRISFEGMDGSGTLSMSGRRLILLDPRGRSTVYVHGSSN